LPVLNIVLTSRRDHTWRGGRRADLICRRRADDRSLSALPIIYILRCRDGSLYTGIAKDLLRRLERHRLGKASKYTRSRLPVILVWKRRLLTWSRALKEERRIKALTRAQKEALLSVAAAAGKRRRS
jgi:predicted GIY-YIG superfamily endonuclease